MEQSFIPKLGFDSVSVSVHTTECKSSSDTEHSLAHTHTQLTLGDC